MRELGAIVRHAGEAFPSATHDGVWLAQCGAWGWVVLMRDKRVRRRPLELAALRANNVVAFVCTAGRARPRICPMPSVGSFTSSSTFRSASRSRASTLLDSAAH